MMHNGHAIRAYKGFTLLEMVTVIAVMSVIMFIAAPRFSSGDIFTTRGDASMLTASLRYAQKTALAQRHPVYMVYHNTTPASLDLCFSVDCSNRVTDPVNGQPYRVSFSRDVAVQVASVGFDALGRPIPNTDANFVVANAKNNLQTIAVVVEAESGYIH